jgi:hypothetical protein
MLRGAIDSAARASKRADMRRRPLSLLLTTSLTLTLGLAPTGCNLFASFASKTRSTVNALAKRNVDFDRPAPAEKDLAEIHTVNIAALEGSDAQRIAGYLATYLSESERFALVTAAPAVEEAPAAGHATIEGSIVESNYAERMDAQTSKCGDNKTCTTRTRIGTAVVSVNLRLVDKASGEVLLQKTVGDRKEEKSSAVDSDPPSIDGQALLDEVSRTAAGQFFAAVSPHIVQETVFFETDSKAKSLKEGANRAMGGDLEGAIEAFRQGLAEAEGKRDESALAKARFDLGLALVIDGEYDEGIELLRAAQRPKARKAWTEIVLAATRWRDDAEHAQRQWKSRGEPPPPLEPGIRESEGATENGTKAIRALRSVAQR